MFARIVSLELKVNIHKQFSELFEKQILDTGVGAGIETSSREAIR
jgi:hypothetical protein